MLEQGHLEDTFEAHHVLLVVGAYVHGRAGAWASPQCNDEEKVSECVCWSRDECICLSRDECVCSSRDECVQAR